MTTFMPEFDSLMREWLCDSRKMVDVCDVCYEDIYEGDDYISNGEKNLCMDCVTAEHKLGRIMENFLNKLTAEEILMLDGYGKKTA